MVSNNLAIEDALAVMDRSYTLWLCFMFYEATLSVLINGIKIKNTFIHHLQFGI